MKLVEIGAEPPGRGGNRLARTRERAAASWSSEERVMANDVTAPNGPIENETPTTPFAPRVREAGG